jgi:hypothetical protein
MSPIVKVTFRRGLFQVHCRSRVGSTAMRAQDPELLTN